MSSGRAIRIRWADIGVHEYSVLRGILDFSHDGSCRSTRLKNYRPASRLELSYQLAL